MFSGDEVLARAKSYDFESIREYVENGGNIHVYDGYGNSLLSALLFGYYENVFSNDPDETAFLAEHEDDEVYHAHVNKYCRMPLEERPHKIKEQIEYLMQKGLDVNAVGWEEATAYQEYSPCVETPLFHTVVHCDYCMTLFLLEAGANPNVKLFSDGNYESLGYEDWLLEHLDIYLYEDTGDAMQLDIDMAALLMQYGLDQWPGGLCIDVDKETRTITGHGLIPKF